MKAKEARQQAVAVEGVTLKAAIRCTQRSSREIKSWTVRRLFQVTTATHQMGLLPQALRNY